MRRYDETVAVQRGLVAGQEAPERFVWRDRWWVVRDVVAHWTQTGAWWESGGARALLGVEETSGDTGVAVVERDLLAEREVWRVEAVRAAHPAQERADDEVAGYGVFDLAFDWGGGTWSLVSSLD